MSDTSPLFLSSVELLAHAVELYADERKHKFVVLHLANAVEVLLKDVMVDQGLSIYESKKATTVRPWAAFDSLEAKGVSFPERPIIEILIDDRNTIQHRFGSPDAKTVSHYLDQVVRFFSRILREEYGGLALSEVLSHHLDPAQRKSIGLPAEPGASSDVSGVFEQSPEWAFLYVFGSIEAVAQGLLSPGHETTLFPFQHSDLPRAIADLADAGYVPSDTMRRLPSLIEVRNRVAHSGGSSSGLVLTKQDFSFLQELLEGLKRAQAEGFGERHEGPATVIGDDT